MSWFPISATYSVSSPVTTRDPSIIQYPPVTGPWYVAYTNGTSGQNPASTFTIISSNDLVNWSHITDVTVGNFTDVWAPEFFIDSDGSLHVAVVAGPTGTTAACGANTHLVFEVHPLTSNLAGSWSTFQSLLPSTVTCALDPYWIKTGSTYNLFYSNWTSGSNVIGYATASSLLGPYTEQSSAGLTALGSGSEGPSVIPLGSGYRLYFDSGAAQINYSDNAAGDFVTWTAKQPVISGTPPRHGTVLFTAPWLFPSK